MTLTTDNLSKIVKIHTSDHKVLEVTNNLINECKVFKMAVVDHPEVNDFIAPFKNSGFNNAFKFLDFFGQNKPGTLDYNNDAFLQATKPAMKFLHSLSNEDKTDLLVTINYLQCTRLDACIAMYIMIVLKNFKIEDCCELSDFVEITTKDCKTVKISRKIIEESQFLISYYKAFGSIPTGRAPFSSHAYQKAFKALSLCDLDTPHLPLATFVRNAPLTPEMLAIAQENQPVMDYFKKLMNLDLYEVATVASTLSMPRLLDLLNIYIMTLDEDMRERVLRGQSAIYEYFRHVEGIEEGDDDGYILPAEGA